jgi:hypothetical protein
MVPTSGTSVVIWARLGSNQRPLACEAIRLPLQVGPAAAPADHRARMPSTPGVHTTATVLNRPPNAASERAGGQTPLSNRMHPTLPGRSGRGQNSDHHTQPKMTEIARTA